jgi:glycosyl hydrolase family 12
MRRLLQAAVVTVLLAAAAVVVGVSPASAATTCAKFGQLTIQNGRYIVQNNVWGADTTQCVNTTTNGFTITRADHNKATGGAPAAYPSTIFGCHYGACSANSGLPQQASSSGFNNIRTSVNMGFINTGTWDAAYDIWFDPTPRTNGQNTGAEIMVWLNHRGTIQPVGSRVATVSIAGASWDIWFGNVGWNVVSYVRTTASTSASFAVNDFLSNAISRGWAQRSWYLTSIQSGFEPWVGGAGLAVNSFAVTR